MSGEPELDDQSRALLAGLAALEAFAPARELVRGLVAMFKDDGFDDDAARALVVTTVTGWRFNKDTEGNG